MKKWLKENIAHYLKISSNTRARSVILLSQLVGSICFIITYSLFRNSLSEYGVWIVMSYYIGALIVMIPFTIITYSNPNYGSYYLFHLSAFPKLIIIISIPLFLLLFLYVQCREYNLPINFVCIRKIFF
ncbi:MAG: hypothetical protein US53_C0027G0008 [Candidatus Woesebacteria bacterium GW2011_GWA1_37_7]|uniref:Polysaccharide biosynthesis protein n=1 Tax=Candidatus Woesebacteria bacterium GW2011_GWA1_37_7 TaxID=1618545 RepID=A0A0G0H1M7_9BACT|nr:MAG: hypothetical protein US53_C0027G0008 [Candidatus Woesebacteria bacterium GW2011_GWA1_37_7]